MQGKEKRLVNNTLIFMLGSIGAKFIQFLLVPLYTYTLSTFEYGVTELVLTAANLLMPVFSVSIADGLLRFGLDSKLDKGDVLKNSLFIIFIGSIISIFCYPIFSINSSISDWMIEFLLILNLRIYRDVLAINLKINDRNKLFASDSILYTFGLCSLSFIFLVVFELGIKGYFWAYIIANILSITYLIIVSRPIKSILESKLQKKLIMSLLVYSFPMVMNGVAWWITNASDRFMIEWLMTESDVGIYSVAAKLPSFITTFTGVFNQAWIISAVIEYDNEKEKRFYEETFHKYYFILFLGTSLLLLVLKPFMYLYVSPDFFAAWKYAAVLICSAIVSGIAAFTGGIYAATKKNKNLTITTFLGAVVNMILNYGLISKFGIMGAAIATYISWLLIAFIRLWDVRKFFEFYVDYKRLIFYTIITLVQCVSLIMIRNTIWISLIVIIFISVIERKYLLSLVEVLKKKIKR